jgi:hypothetical protein
MAGGGAYRHWREPMTHGFEHTGSRLWFSIPKNVALTLGQTANRLIGSCDQYWDILGPEGFLGYFRIVTDSCCLF